MLQSVFYFVNLTHEKNGFIFEIKFYWVATFRLYEEASTSRSSRDCSGTDFHFYI